MKNVAVWFRCIKERRKTYRRRELEHVENQRVGEGGKSGAGLPAQPEKDEPDHRGNALDEDERCKDSDSD